MRTLLLLAGLALTSCDQMAAHQLDDIHAKVAKDAEEQYRMVEKSGTKTDLCVRAGMVAEAYLQAKNSEKYDLWKTTQKADCMAAGVPQ